MTKKQIQLENQFSRISPVWTLRLWGAPKHSWSSSNGLLGCFCRATEFVAFIKSVAWLALSPEDLYRLARIVAWKIESRGSHEDLYRIAHFVEWRIVSHMRNFYHILRIVAWGILSRCRVRNFIALSREECYRIVAWEIIRIVAWGILSHYSYCLLRNFCCIVNIDASFLVKCFFWRILKCSNSMNTSSFLVGFSTDSHSKLTLMTSSAPGSDISLASSPYCSMEYCMVCIFSSETSMGQNIKRPAKLHQNRGRGVSHVYHHIGSHSPWDNIWKICSF